MRQIEVQYKDEVVLGSDALSLPAFEPNSSHHVLVKIDPGHHHSTVIAFRVKFEMHEFKGGRVKNATELEFRRSFKVCVRPLDATLQALPLIEGKHSMVLTDTYGKLLIESSFRNVINCPLTISIIELNLELFGTDCDMELAEGEQITVIGKVTTRGRQAAKIVYSLGDMGICEFRTFLCDVAVPAPSFTASLTAPPVVVWNKPFQAILTIENLTNRVLMLYFNVDMTRGFLSEGPTRMKLNLFAKQSVRYVYTFVALYTCSKMLPQIQITDLSREGEPMLLVVPVVIAHQ
jgi:hypothetical protein